MSAADQVRVLAERYRLDCVIGRGGMGVVWQARDQLLDRDVAVKEIVWEKYLDNEEQDASRRSAIREAQTAARLSHPNVIGIYDVITENDRPWIVMEYLPFPSLRDIVTEDGPLSPGVAAHVGLGILAALDAAHSQGVLHRDVKPANVLVGPDGTAVLTDFGIARATDSQVTTASVILGSPSYICPERARGEKAGPAGDLWGLGATLYAAVEGKPPFERGSALATLAAVVMDDPEPAVQAGPLWPVISGLLRKDPAERLGAAEVGEMLASLAVGPSDLARTTAPLRQVPAVPAQPSGPPTSAEAAAPRAPEPQASGSRASGSRASEPRAEGESSATLAARPYEDGRRRRSWVSLAMMTTAAVVAVGAAVAVGVLAASLSPGHTPGTADLGGSRHPAASPSMSAPVPSSADPSAGPSGSALPAGSSRYTDPTGFSIAVPHGWQVSHTGHDVTIADPADSGTYLLIDQSSHPKPDPLADWRQQQANRAGSYPGYHLIRLASVNYPQAEKAADWEFTYTRGGVPVHILNRNVLANAHHAYALYWSAPVKNWSADYPYFQAFAASFRPAP